MKTGCIPSMLLMGGIHGIGHYQNFILCASYEGSDNVKIKNEDKALNSLLIPE